MPAPYQGQCLCGGCKIFVDEEPALDGLGVCHCKDCARLSGPSYGIVAVSTKSVRAEGSVKLYESVNSLTGNTVSRWFCGDCGSHLLGRSSARPEFTSVKAGSFTEFTNRPIVIEIFTKDRWPSIPPVPGALQFEDGTVDTGKLMKGAQDESTKDKESAE